MAENLNIGTMVGGNISPSDNSIIEKYCIDMDISNCAIYGGLYRWDEMMQYVTTEGTRGVCPTGWHLPTDDEYKTLEMQLGMTQAQADGQGGRGTEQGSQLAGNESLWINGPLDQNGLFGSSGFTALPGSYRFENGGFEPNGKAYFWTSSEAGGGQAWFREVDWAVVTVFRKVNPNATSLSVRCVQD